MSERVTQTWFIYRHRSILARFGQRRRRVTNGVAICITIYLGWVRLVATIGKLGIETEFQCNASKQRQGRRHRNRRGKAPPMITQRGVLPVHAHHDAFRFDVGIRNATNYASFEVVKPHEIMKSVFCWEVQS